MQVYATGAPVGALVTAELWAFPTTGGSSKLITATAQADQAGTWEFRGDWPPTPGANAELLNQADCASKYGAGPNYLWKIIVPTAAGTVSGYVAITGPRGAVVDVGTLTTQTPT